MPPRLFSYRMTHDTGFAPNPFGGFLTLATCKPRIRRDARVNDLIMGTGSAKDSWVDRVIYVGEVSAILSIEQYAINHPGKIPNMRGTPEEMAGDNIYFKSNERWRRVPNPHHPKALMKHDLGGESVLVCQQYWYFGENAPQLDARLLRLISPGRPDIRVSDSELITALRQWLENEAPQGGILGAPSHVIDRGRIRCR
jgi:hypothetical protein